MWEQQNRFKSCFGFLWARNRVWGPSVLHQWKRCLTVSKPREYIRRGQHHHLFLVANITTYESFVDHIRHKTLCFLLWNVDPWYLQRGMEHCYWNPRCFVCGHPASVQAIRKYPRLALGSQAYTLRNRPLKQSSRAFSSVSHRLSSRSLLSHFSSALSYAAISPTRIAKMKGAKSSWSTGKRCINSLDGRWPFRMRRGRR